MRFFTTRPDTVFGVSFMVLAPEHPLVAEIAAPRSAPTVEAYVTQARRQSEIERLSTVKEKTGVFTGAYARNLFSQQDIPIWIADYVLMGYGTGAIMARARRGPARLRIRRKVRTRDSARHRAARRQPAPPPDRAFTEHGVTVNSGFLNGMKTADAIRAVCRYVEEHGIGRPTVSYRMRDWLISRQRYWGVPDSDRLLQAKNAASCRCRTSNCRSCCPT